MPRCSCDWETLSGHSTPLLGLLRPSGLLAFNGRYITILVYCLSRNKEENSEGEVDKLVSVLMPAPSSLRIAIKIPKMGTIQEYLTHPLLD